MKEYTLPHLPYAFDELEPVISRQIMELHYLQHHQSYLNNLNNCSVEYREAEQRSDLQKILSLQKNIQFNGGGHINHSLFWDNLAPIARGGGVFPSKGAFADAVKVDFGSFEKMIELFNNHLSTFQGSGWGWLGYDKKVKKLLIVTTPNQDPLVNYGYLPLLGIDLWEHSYYLQYKNLRSEYIKKIWLVIDWDRVEKRWKEAQ